MPIHFIGGFMQASILDLRYKMKDILQALDRRERVKILYHGKHKGTIVPVSDNKRNSIKDHPFFGMRKDDAFSVSEIMNNLRKGRYNDI
jgi:hypothetical protein